MAVTGQMFSLFAWTERERASFDQLGFVVRRDAWDAELVSFLHVRSNELGRQARQQLKLINHGRTSPAEWASRSSQDLIVVPEAGDPECLCRFEFILGNDPAMAGFVTARLMPMIDSLLGEAFIPFKDKENEKTPGGGAFRPHQDFAAYQAFGPRYNVTAMLSIDPGTLENGCVEFATNAMDVAGRKPQLVQCWIEGRPLFAHYNGGEKNGDILDEISEQLVWQPVPTASSDLVLFDSFVPHRSQANGSASQRRAMFLTFSARREGDWYSPYYLEKRANYADPKFHVSTPTVHAS